MAVNEVHLNDVRTNFRAVFMDNQTIVNVSSGTDIRFIFLKPDCTSAIQTATVTNDGSDGMANWLSPSGFIDQVGLWEFQGYIAFGTGARWYTERKAFRVYDNLVEI